jgi:hypothetical protein
MAMLNLSDDELATVRTALLYMKNSERDIRLMHTWQETMAIIGRIDAVTASLQSPAPAQEGQPDWSKAPKWAQWWTMDKDGKQEWWEEEPILNDKYTWWLYDWSKAPHRHIRVEFRPDKNGIDWRTLKRQRPAATAERGGE